MNSSAKIELSKQSAMTVCFFQRLRKPWVYCSESTTDGLLTPLEMDLPKHEEWVRLLTTEPSYENLITQLRKHRAHTRYFKSQISLQLLIALTLKLLFKSLFTSQFTNETNGSHSVTADPKFEECPAEQAVSDREFFKSCGRSPLHGIVHCSPTTT